MDRYAEAFEHEEETWCCRCILKESQEEKWGSPTLYFFSLSPPVTVFHGALCDKCKQPFGSREANIAAAAIGKIARALMAALGGDTPTEEASCE
ncbi:MAG: hypothetical protein K8R90_05305 [Candidatus Cloacimonetes bacterium]|nr:hypothetical protein [Candidatus Cloacimonadota bacterium]